MKDVALWSSLPAFLAIADHGGLTAAARATGQSAATLSRHIATLEAHLGQRLVHRGARGYRLTPEGDALLPLAREMEAGARRITDLSASAPAPPMLRLSAGPWTALWLAHHLPTAPDWQVEITPAVGLTDIARRDMDIGIRNARPSQPWLAGKRVGRVSYAAYGTAGGADAWITLSGAAARLPSARWAARQSGERGPATPDVRIAAALAAAGHGQVVLPCFVAPLVPGLVQTGPEITALCSEEWLVSHHNARTDPPLRAALKAIGQTLAGKSA